MKIYLKLIFTVILLVVIFGIVLPFLISYPDNLLVWLGFLIISIIPIILFLVWKKEIKILKEKIKG